MRRRLLTLGLILSLSLAASAGAQRRITFEQITVADTAIGITAAITAGMSACTVHLETAVVRWRIDAAPTSTVGTPLYPTDDLTFEHIADAKAVKFIRTTSTSGQLDVTCWSIQ